MIIVVTFDVWILVQVRELLGTARQLRIFSFRARLRHSFHHGLVEFTDPPMNRYWLTSLRQLTRFTLSRWQEPELTYDRIDDVQQLPLQVRRQRPRVS